MVDLTKPQAPHEKHQLDGTASLSGCLAPASADTQSLKRRRPSFDDPDESLSSEELPKRAKTEDSACEVSTPVDHASNGVPVLDMDLVRDEIQHQLGLEVLLKHDELRLINQELAKCQVALEQLRRCHLIPYPVASPTPTQMLEVSAGQGAALQSQSGQGVPRWAPPFGITEGPYARHYAKWLIPDPSFDGVEPEWQFTAEAARARTSFNEGRATRNSFAEPGSATKGRPSRANAGAKLHALSNGYPQPKEKAGPCILKRSDGKTVKLVCLDCHRENFSSTQGFINHCRIAHKRLFESHDEAALQSGQLLSAEELSPTTLPTPAATNTTARIAEKPLTTPVVNASSGSATAFVHPLARTEMTDSEACVALRSRIAASLELYKRGELTHIRGIPGSERTKSQREDKVAKFDGSPDTPYLSRLLQNRKFSGSLGELVKDAKLKISYEDITPDEDSDILEDDVSGSHQPDSHVNKRTPARKIMSSASCGPSKRPVSSIGRSRMTFVPPPQLPTEAIGTQPTADFSQPDMELEEANLSPNTLVSNNAPSLVSDDGEYDDTDDATSVSGASEVLNDESDTDVAEITMDDDHEPRAIRERPDSLRFRKDEGRHVTFMNTVKAEPKGRKARKA